MGIIVPQIYDVVEIPARWIEVQVRKHRKKRINKKWRKRYGVRMVYDMSCYLYDDGGRIRILAPPRVAQKIRDDIGLMNIGVINDISFWPKFASCNAKDAPFEYKGGST